MVADIVTQRGPPELASWAPIEERPARFCVGTPMRVTRVGATSIEQAGTPSTVPRQALEKPVSARSMNTTPSVGGLAAVCGEPTPDSGFAVVHASIFVWNG
jgi:hypothetical protein